MLTMTSTPQPKRTTKEISTK